MSVLARLKYFLNGSPLAFGEGNVKGRIKNVLNYKKPRFWVMTTSFIIIIVVGIALVTNLKKGNTIQRDDNLMGSSSDTPERQYRTEYNKVKIHFLSGVMEFMSTNEFETNDFRTVAYINSTLKASMTPAQEDDLNNNHTNQYMIELSNDIGGYSCGLYHDTLYDKAYVVKDGGIYEVGIDFARYINSFMENANIDFHIDDADAVALFQTYGWTIDYQISSMKRKFNNIKVLTGFNPSAYYFAYNNELSKDIGLDMSGYSNATDIDIKIYRVHESMPREFYPIQDCRGIVVKNGDKIIGAFISAGRHSTFNACSLKGNSFEKVTDLTLNEWFSKMIKVDSTEERLAKLEPEQVIAEYFMSIDKKDAKASEYCISKKALLGNLTSNMLNEELYNEGIGLPLTEVDIGAKSNFDNLKSAKLFKTKLIDEPDKNTKVLRVTVDLQYNNEVTISSGQQDWDCQMVYESPQTGWKIEGFGH